MGPIPETNSKFAPDKYTPCNLQFAPENRPSQKETIVFQPSIFRCYVSLREGNPLSQAIWAILEGEQPYLGRPY